MIEQKVIDGIEKYTGERPKSIEIAIDAKVKGTYAIRSKTKNKTYLYWLLVGVDNNWTADDVCNNLEECEFTTWPPISGQLKFF